MLVLAVMERNRNDLRPKYLISYLLSPKLPERNIKLTHHEEIHTMHYNRTLVPNLYGISLDMRSE